jgi:DNA helicase-2/ATP-dependent DNA helicase PcrA
MSRLETIESGGPSAQVAQVMEFYQPYLEQRFDDHPRRMRDLDQVADLAHNYRSTYRFLADLALDPPTNLFSGHDRNGRLTLSTVHSAKGLEWEAVFIIWATEGRFPAGPALEDEEALEEERRMMYVASTRAKDRLFLCSPVRSFSHHQGAVFHTRSRFLDEAAFLLNPFRPQPQACPAPRELRPEEPRESPPEGGGPAVGTAVSHPAFGQGRVAGYLGHKRIVVLFPGHGHKTLHLDYAPLTPAEA